MGREKLKEQFEKILYDEDTFSGLDTVVMKLLDAVCIEFGCCPITEINYDYKGSMIAGNVWGLIQEGVLKYVGPCPYCGNGIKEEKKDGQDSSTS